MSQVAAITKIPEVTLRRYRRSAALRLLKVLDDYVRPVNRRVGDEESPDAVIAACEGPLGHTEYGFLLARSPFPAFTYLLRPVMAMGSIKLLTVIEEEFQELEEVYGDNQRKWFKALLFEAGEHYYLYTDQPLQEYEELSIIRTGARGRMRYVCSLEAFVEAARNHK